MIKSKITGTYNFGGQLVTVKTGEEVSESDFKLFSDLAQKIHFEIIEKNERKSTGNVTKKRK